VVGIGHWGPLTELSLEEWDYQHRINLTSFFLPARLLARALIADKRPGAIVGVTSISGLTTAPSHAAYGAAKAGMANLVRSMTAEWAPHGIRVNAVAPGSIATPRFQHDPEVLEMMESKLPMGRLGTTDDIAKSITFLLSDLASYVSGHTLLVDGGWSSAYLLDMSFRDRK
jgi:3-oxoacyl-[acyl-carrier protein] reductase